MSKTEPTNKDDADSKEEAAPVAKPKLGQVVRLRATQHELTHYSEGTRFTTDDSTKIAFDDWCSVQWDANKLALDV